MGTLANIDHPLVQQTAQQLVTGTINSSEALNRIFLYVRDTIKFEFPPEGDFVTASQTIERGYGQCNTKSILFLALCKAVGIPARIHFSSISKEIQHGFFTTVAYWLMPDNITHSWIEVEIDGRWYSIDTYINDLQLHTAAVARITERGWETGYSISRANGEPSADLVLDNDHYSQMAAVTGDNGVWDDPSEFMHSYGYLNSVGPVRRWLYRLLLPMINRRVRRLRKRAAGFI